MRVHTKDEAWCFLSDGEQRFPHASVFLYENRALLPGIEPRAYDGR